MSHTIFSFLGIILKYIINVTYNIEVYINESCGWALISTDTRLCGPRE